jgi:hypothetical protein
MNAAALALADVAWTQYVRRAHVPAVAQMPRFAIDSRTLGTRSWGTFISSPEVLPVRPDSRIEYRLATRLKRVDVSWSMIVRIDRDKQPVRSENRRQTLF